MVHKTETEEAISAQRWHTRKRGAGLDLEQWTRHLKILMSNSGGKRETGEDEWSISARGMRPPHYDLLIRSIGK